MAEPGTNEVLSRLERVERENRILKSVVVLLLVVVGTVSYSAFSSRNPNTNIVAVPANPNTTIGAGRTAPETNIVDAMLKCTQLYELKKEAYWGGRTGQNKAIFSPSLNTCLALNIYNDADMGYYYAMVVDMQNDKTLLFYTDKERGFYFDRDNRINCENRAVSLEYGGVIEQGCDKFGLMDKMFGEVRKFGFTVFSAG